MNKFGSRPIMMAGGCLSGTGLVAASFCNSVEGLYFCVGVIGGKNIKEMYKEKKNTCIKKRDTVLKKHHKVNMQSIVIVWYHQL